MLLNMVCNFYPFFFLLNGKAIYKTGYTRLPTFLRKKFFFWFLKKIHPQ